VIAGGVPGFLPRTIASAAVICLNRLPCFDDALAAHESNLPAVFALSAIRHVRVRGLSRT
jgi:hypothetical protein